VTTIVPANVAVVANAPNKAGGRVLRRIPALAGWSGGASRARASARLPVNPAVYAKAPVDYPNPFKDTSLGARVKFDVNASEKRTAAVDTLFASVR
jgi:hypothetical protein